MTVLFPSSLIQTMATRQSLRLLGMEPDLKPFQDKCFICQLDLDIQAVKRCRVMPCCGKFIHKRCHKKARETTSQCGHCRVGGTNNTDSDEEEVRVDEDSDTEPAWVTPPELLGPTLIETARNAIAQYRSSALAHSVHQPGTRSWQRLPFRIDPMVWYLFWVNLDWFISTIPEEPRPLYIHAMVYSPVDPVEHVRKTIYRLITQIIPAEVRACLSHIKHRIQFRQIADFEAEVFPYPYDPNEITFTQIRLTRFWSTIYYHDYPYTTDIPATPPESPSPQR